MVSASTKLSKLGMISASEATTALTSSLKAFNLAAEDAIKVVDKLTKVDAQAAVSAGGIATALQKSATSAKLAGMSMDELIGSVSVIGEVTQQSMDTVGHAMKSILARYGNVKASVFTQMGLNDDGETTENINDIEKVLSKLGIRMRSSSTELRDITDVLDEVNEKWDTYDTVTKNALATAFGGTRMRENFLVLMENWDRVKELTEESANAAGTADEKYSAYMDSMEAATKRFRNAWEGLVQSLETSPLIKGITNITASFTENAIEGFGWLKKLMPLLLTLQSGSIIGAFTNPGETGGFRGLLKNIPVIGGFVKSNDAIQQIAKDVHEIKEETAGPAAKTKNGGALKKIWQGLTGRQDIVDPKTGKSISYDDLKFAKKWGVNSQNSAEYAKYAKLLRQRRIGNAAFGGASAALAQFAITKQVGAGQGGFLDQVFGFNKAIAGGSEQTVEETAGGKALRTLAAGGLAAAGGALFGPLGAMIGQSIGEGAASIISTIVHRSEIEMKQRVVDAKSRDKELSNIKSSIDSISLDLGDEVEDYEVYQKRKTEVDAIRDQINLSDDAVRGMINVAAIGKGYSGGYDEMLDKLLDTNISSSDRAKIKNDLEYIISSEKAKNYRDTQLIELEKLNKAKAAAENQYAGGFEWLENANFWDSGNVTTLFTSGAFQDALQKAKDLGYITKESFAKSDPFGESSWNIRAVGDTADERIANYAKFRDVLKEIGKIGYFDIGDYQFGDWYNAAISFGGKNRLLQNMISALDSMIANYNQGPKLQSEWQSNYALAGIYGSGLSLMKPSKLKELGLEGAIQEVADFMDKTFNIVVRDESGNIIKETYEDIKKAIKDDETLYGSLATPYGSIEDWKKKQQELSVILEKIGMNENELSDAAEKGGESFEELSKKVGMTTMGLRSLLNLGSSEYLSEMAESIGLTEEQLLAFTDTVKGLDKVSLFAFMLTPSQLTEKFDLMREAYMAAIDGSWAGDDELLNKINSDSFVKGFITNINDVETTAKELGDILYSSGQTLESFLSGFALFSEIQTSATQMEGFINYLKEVNPELKSTVEDMNNIKEVLDYIAKNPDDTKKLREVLEAYLQIQETNRYTEDLQKSMDAVVKINEQQIENLQQQKDSLSKINDERKKEIEYIKAKYALEDARKEKKRVFRAGVGWTYESDETAISEAKEKIDTLDIEKQQDLLQVQIDQLEQQNSILEKLPDEKELEELKAVLENLNGSTLISAATVAALVDKYNNPNYTFDMRAYIDNYIKNWGSTSANASGTTSFPGGQTLINELGTEAVITPGGTLTALPSKTGIVPADITRNVWALGEVAPTLIARLGSLTQKPLAGNGANTTYEEGQYIDNLTMNVYPAKGDDFNKILEQARAQVRLTRRNN